MNEPFNVNRYWLERGQNYIRERFPKEFHQLQEQFLLDVLRASRIPLTRILELGCGFGRITRRLAETFPNATITALDLSPVQLENARRRCAAHSNVCFAPYDFYSGAPFLGSNYDAVIAIEVFLHHPRAVVRGLFERLAAVGRYLVNIDWSEAWPWPTPEHVWVHDYVALHAQAGLQCAAFVLPQKVDGLQQKLFIASPQLSLALVELERKMRRAAADLVAGDAGDRQTPGTSLPEAALWPRQIELAVSEIREAVPSGATFILVNDDQWGNEPRVLAGYRVLPFLEREGRYWGPPADDDTAVRELQRLRASGADHLAFAWCSFWWLDHYSRLCEYLQRTGTLVLRNERLVIFRLTT